MNLCRKIIVLALACSVIAGNADAMRRSKRLAEKKSRSEQPAELKRSRSEAGATPEVMEVEMLEVQQDDVQDELQEAFDVMRALFSNDQHATELVTQYRGDVNFFINDQTPLHFAAAQGNLPAVKALLACGAFVDICNDFGETSLHCAARSGNPAIAHLLCLRGAMVDAADKNGSTPLICAIIKNDEVMVTTLRLYGANPNCKDGFGNSPLIYALTDGLTNVVKDLVAQGADIEGPLRACFKELPLKNIVSFWNIIGLDYCASNGQTLLHLAVNEENVRLVSYLLARGINPNAQDNQGNTPLHGCASRAIADALIKHGARIDVRNNAGETPLDCAVLDKQEQLVTYLQQKAVDSVQASAGDSLKTETQPKSGE